jgi:hypothetical protein
MYILNKFMLNFKFIFLFYLFYISIRFNLNYFFNFYNPFWIIMFDFHKLKKKKKYSTYYLKWSYRSQKNPKLKLPHPYQTYRAALMGLDLKSSSKKKKK